MSQRSGSPPRSGLYSPRVSGASAAAAGLYNSPAVARNLTRQTLALQGPSPYSPLAASASAASALGMSSTRRTVAGSGGLGSTLGGLGSPSATATAPLAAAGGLTVRTPGVKSLQSQLQADILALNADLAKMSARTAAASAARAPAAPPAASALSSAASTGRYAAPHMAHHHHHGGAKPAPASSSSASTLSIGGAGAPPRSPEADTIRASMQKAA